MPRYQVALVTRPDGWQHATLDDVPPTPGRPVEVLAEEDELRAAVKQAIEHNRQTAAEQGDRWAVVVEPGSYGRTWPGARLCTPLSYKVMAIWWPEGWEPHGPLDVPNCLWQSQGAADDKTLTFDEAEATVQSLNRQCMDNAGATWYVISATEHESISRTVSYDPSGTETTVEVRRMHVIRPDSAGHGDCACCPAHNFECAKAQWQSQEQNATSQRTCQAPGESD